MKTLNEIKSSMNILIENILFKGILSKRGQLNPAFKKRYFYLVGDTFNHYKVFWLHTSYISFSVTDSLDFLFLCIIVAIL